MLKAQFGLALNAWLGVMTLTLRLSHAIAPLTYIKLDLAKHTNANGHVSDFSPKWRDGWNPVSRRTLPTPIWMLPPCLERFHISTAPPQTLSLNICFSISNPNEHMPERGDNKIIGICLPFISFILPLVWDSSIMPFSGMCPAHSNVEIFLFLFSFLFSFGLSLLSERKSLEIMSYVGSDEQYSQ